MPGTIIEPSGRDVLQHEIYYLLRGYLVGADEAARSSARPAHNVLPVHACARSRVAYSPIDIGDDSSILIEALSANIE